MIKSMDWCRVVSRKLVKGSGLDMGELVLVVGVTQAPVSAKDPYLTRTYVRVARTDDDNLPLIPGDNDHKVYLVDPRSLEKVSEDEQRQYNNGVADKFS